MKPFRTAFAATMGYGIASIIIGLLRLAATAAILAGILIYAGVIKP